GDPFNDIFEVEVSDDAGGSWVDLETVGPSGPEVSGGWFYKEFRIADVAGIANTSQFQVRFTASDLGGGSVIEAGVDGVQIVSRGCDGSIPEDLDGDGMVSTSDLLILLSAWGPCPDPPDPCPADFDGDGSVGTSDLLQLLSAWG
ncbi:MAG: dockerin type I domain-containing protein, partial [Planctomycetota bacterium]